MFDNKHKKKCFVSLSKANIALYFALVYRTDVFVPKFGLCLVNSRLYQNSF